MRIVVSLLNYRPGMIGGAETYLKGLLEHWPAVKQDDDEIFLVGHQGNANNLQIAGLKPVILDKSDRRVVLARCMEAFTPLRARFAEKALAELRPDVVLFPQQSMFPKRSPYPSVLVVVDIQHLILPQYFSRFDRTFRAAIYPPSLARADKIIAISEWTRRTVIDRCGVAPEKIVAIQPGFTSRPVSAAASWPSPPVEGPYLFLPAATLRHKGHKTLFPTYAALRRRGDFPYKLVLTGRHTAYWSELRRQIAELGITDDVIPLGYLTYEEVDQVYQGAAAVVFPTEFEGFGLPVFEAVHFGKKVICSRLAVFDEIGVPRQFQIDFRDPNQLYAALALPGPTALEKEPLSGPEAADRVLTALRATAHAGRASGDNLMDKGRQQCR